MSHIVFPTNLKSNSRPAPCLSLKNPLSVNMKIVLTKHKISLLKAQFSVNVCCEYYISVYICHYAIKYCVKNKKSGKLVLVSFLNSIYNTVKSAQSVVSKCNTS